MEYRAPAWIAANTPDAHLPDATSPGLKDDAARNADDYRDEVTFPMPAQRVYRPGYSSDILTGNQPAAAQTQTPAESFAAHATVGAPEYLDNDDNTGSPYGPDDMALSPIPENVIAERDNMTPDWPGFLQSPRAGGNSADNTRPSMRQQNYLIRPFDKLISEHPDDLGRIMSAPPFAARPRQFAEPIAGAFPSPGGHGATVGSGGGVSVGPQLNSVRLIPNPWDTSLVNEPQTATDPGVQAVAAQVSSGWRAR